MKRAMHVLGVVGLLGLMSCGQQSEESKVIDKFKKGDEAGRAAAISQMAALKGQESKVVPYLIKGLGDESAKVRLASVQAISVVEGAFAKASAKVTEIAQGDPDVQARVAAIECLVLLSPDAEEVADDVASILGGDDLPAAMYAASVLGTRAGSAAVPYKALASVMSVAIQNGKRDDQVSVCTTALASLAAAGPKAADALPVLDACAAEGAVDPKAKKYLQALAKVIRGTGSVDELSQAQSDLME